MLFDEWNERKASRVFFCLIFLLSFLPHSITERFEVPKMSRLNVLLDVLV